MSSGLVDMVKKIKSRLMKLMNKAIDTLYEKVFTPILNILCLIILISIFVAIISRYIFHYAIIWSPEICRFLYIYVIFIGTFLGIKQNKHIGLDIVIDHNVMSGLLDDIIPWGLDQTRALETLETYSDLEPFIKAIKPVVKEFSEKYGAADLIAEIESLRLYYQ